MCPPNCGRLQLASRGSIASIVTTANSIEIFETYHRPVAPEPAIRPFPLYQLDGVEKVVFDVYGTLFVSAAGEPSAVLQKPAKSITTNAAFRRALSDAGFEANDALVDFVATAFRTEIEQFHFKHSGGAKRPHDRAEVDIRRIWESVIDKAGQAGLVYHSIAADEEIESLAARYECLANPVSMMPGAAEILEKLNNHGLELGIVSNAQFFTPIFLEHLLGKSYDLIPAERCIYSYQVGRAKPDPRVFQRLLASAPRTSPPSLLYVGNDMLNDVATAQEAGLRACLFAGDARSLRLREQHPSVKSRRPDTTVCSLNELLLVLGVG